MLGMVLLVSVWQLLILIGGYEEALFPPPLIVGTEIIRMVTDGSIFVHLQVSLGRFAAGYTMAVIPAILLGMLLGRMPRVWRIVDPDRASFTACFTGCLVAIYRPLVWNWKYAGDCHYFYRLFLPSTFNNGRGCSENRP